MAYSYARQLRHVILVEIAIVAIAFAIAYGFWGQLCSGGLDSCIAAGPVAGPLSFLLLCIVRPFVFTPVLFVAIVGGRAFGPLAGALLTAIGSTLSCLCVFGIVKLVGKRLAKPWLRSNLPATFKFIRSQDYKIVFALRLIPIVPFDLVSFVGGALDFRTKAMVLATLAGSLPEAYLFAKLVDPSETVLSATLLSVVGFGLCIIGPLLVFEYLSRRKGTGMFATMKAMYRELHDEVQKSNDIVRRQQYDPTKTPVLLLYGFFSTRRAVTVLEKMLISRGHQVLSFNLGGMMGTFFTRDIIETAEFIDFKIKRQFERHGYKKIHIVAHSKGGMVALWWLLKLGGHQYCDKVITMGTPFSGSILTYLGLVTPLGLLWRDIYQMRPGSSFLRSMNASEVPPGLSIYCLHSESDRVARGRAGIFRPDKGDKRITPIPMNHISHFEFLYRRDVGDTISRLLKDESGQEGLPQLASPPPAS